MDAKHYRFTQRLMPSFQSKLSSVSDGTKLSFTIISSGKMPGFWNTKGKIYEKRKNTTVKKITCIEQYI